MIPCPRAQGLTLCDYVMREERTLKVSLIGTFTGIRAGEFPFSRPFCVFASLTDGLGEGMLELTITRLASDEEIVRLQRSIMFPNRFMDVQVLFRLNEVSFPEEGTYLFSLSVDDDTIAQRRVRVYSNEELP
jgi:hypothetical protein